MAWVADLRRRPSTAPAVQETDGVGNKTIGYGNHNDGDFRIVVVVCTLSRKLLTVITRVIRVLLMPMVGEASVARQVLLLSWHQKLLALLVFRRCCNSKANQVCKEKAGGRGGGSSALSPAASQPGHSRATGGTTGAGVSTASCHRRDRRGHARVLSKRGALVVGGEPGVSRCRCVRGEIELHGPCRASFMATHAPPLGICTTAHQGTRVPWRSLAEGALVWLLYLVETAR